MRNGKSSNAGILSHNCDSFAAILRAWMVGRGLAAQAAADRLGVSHQTVYNWLDGALPPSTRVRALAKLLGRTEDELGSVIRVDRMKARRHAPRRSRGGAA
jgi:transcriptional regulator with XRE-family HTH domain